MISKFTVLLALAGSTFAASTLKNRLAQAEAKQLDCSCELSGNPGQGFPAPGQASYNNFGSGASVSQSTEITTVPDTSYTSQCESDCCACNAAEHTSSASAARTRHYEISGDIRVAETVEYSENGEAKEESAGHSQKQSACANTNANGEGSAPGGQCVTVCV